MLTKFKTLAKDWSLNHKPKARRNSFSVITMCKDCYTFYYKNAWHFERPSYLGNQDDTEIPVHFTRCPACLEQENSMYEGESNLAFS